MGTEADSEQAPLVGVGRQAAPGIPGGADRGAQWPVPDEVAAAQARGAVNRSRGRTSRSLAGIISANVFFSRFDMRLVGLWP